MCQLDLLPLNHETSCVSLVQIETMGSSDEKAQSPELGASSSKAPFTPIDTPDDSGGEDEREEVESDIESEEEVQTEKKHTRVKDTREWVFIAKRTFADHEPEEIEGLLFTECKKLMEATGLFPLSTCKAKSSDILMSFFCGSMAQNGKSGRAPNSMNIFMNNYIYHGIY
jgi:hypothetical protein